MVFIFQITFADVVSEEKVYGVPHAEILYTISGGGALSEDVNLTLEGSGKRRFKGWGETELYETHIVEHTVGTLNDIHCKDHCEKREKTEILEVDFKNKKIMKHPLPKEKPHKYTTVGMRRIGQQMVANVVCDMWEGKGVKRCFYKGIPVFTEYNALGFFYQEEATDVQLDINRSETSKCTLPPYPKQKFSLYTNSFKTKNSKKIPDAFSERLLTVIAYLKKKKVEEDALLPNERKGLKEIMAEPVFRNQKYLLPKLLETMKKTRICLSQSRSTEEANHCLDEMITIKSCLTDSTHKRIASWETSRDEVLEKFEHHITRLQSKMMCIRSAKLFSDLSACMRP
jgi:hypothetical protein